MASRGEDSPLCREQNRIRVTQIWLGVTCFSNLKQVRELASASGAVTAPERTMSEEATSSAGSTDCALLLPFPPLQSSLQLWRKRTAYSLQLRMQR